MKLLSRFLFWITGWKLEGEFPKGVKKVVITAAPHTSNWDFFYARLAFYLLEVPLNYTIKKEMMVGPLGWMLKSMGAIPIDRSPKKDGDARKSMVDAMADLFNERESLAVMVTPEGTRTYVPEWKTGFYYVALKAGVPIVLGFLDYKNKIAGIGPAIHPSGDVEKDIETMKAFYRTKTGKYPELGVK
uniref:1-acyl-sn-glycerol-3-phosphate acyltransferase n=2 Tax=Roseivirga sp. TaxID=1964215 RepID=UPI0040486680